MSATTTKPPCDASLGVDPFVSNRYHFGMLLGVADLEAEQAYLRGKDWLHSAWLHGPGVVWGLSVEVDAERNELLVSPGLAIDRHGRELLVRTPQCVDLGLWFGKHGDDVELEDRDDGELVFAAHVRLCHDTCLDRPVPAISEPCEGSNHDTAYSRSIERGRPELVAGAAPPEPPAAYPLLRQFFGQVPVDNELVTDARADIEAADPADRAAVCVSWFRRIAAFDVTALQPTEDALPWSPVGGDGCIPLADLHVHLRADGEDRIRIVEEGTALDLLIRPSHVRTRTIQELLCHGHGPAPAQAVPPSTGPQVDPEATTVEGAEIRVSFTEPIDDRTVHPVAFFTTVLGDDGWTTIDIDAVTLSSDGLEATVTLAGEPTAGPVRLIVAGAGTSPLLGTDGRPLNGVVGTGRGDPNGRDAALLLTDDEDDPQ